MDKRQYKDIEEGINRLRDPLNSSELSLTDILSLLSVMKYVVDEYPEFYQKVIEEMEEKYE